MQSHASDKPAARLYRAPVTLVVCVVCLVLSLQGDAANGLGSLVFIAVPDAGFPTGPSVESILTSHLFHPSGLSLVGNCLVLLIVGGLLESRWGTPRFLVFYLLCAWGGSLATVALAAAFDVTGCSFGAASFGLGCLAAAGVVFPASGLRWLPPHRLLVWVAILAGGSLLAWVETPEILGPNGEELPPFLVPQVAGVPIALGFTWFLPRLDLWRIRRRELEEERRRRQVREIRGRVERLLEKISAEGYDSLSSDELSFLRDASKHYEGPDGPS